MLISRISLKEINQLAIPAIVAGIIEPVISLTDTVVAGHIPIHTEETLGAVGIVGSFIAAMVWIFAQTSNAIASVVAQGYGQKRISRLKALVSQFVYFNLMVSILFSILFSVFAEELFFLYGVEGKLLGICLQYFNIRIWGFPFTLLTLTLYGVFRGYQNTSWAMKISLIGGLANAVLDVFFVFQLHWNVEGVALASVISQFLMFVISIMVLFRQTPFRLVRLLPIHPNFFTTLKMSLDLLLRTMSLQVALFLAFRVATKLGVLENNSTVAAHTLLIQIWMFSAFFLDGYSSAGSALAGKLFGAKQYDTMVLLVKDLLKIVFIIGGVLAIVYIVFYNPIGLLLTKNAQVLALFYTSFWIVGIMQPINSIAFLFDGIYKGIGRTQPLRNVLIIATFLGFIPTLYFTQFLDWGLKGIWFSFFVWMSLRSLLLYIHFWWNYVKKSNTV